MRSPTKASTRIATERTIEARVTKTRIVKARVGMNNAHTVYASYEGFNHRPVTLDGVVLAHNFL